MASPGVDPLPRDPSRPRSDPVPLRPIGNAGGADARLPGSLTSFIGREHEIAAVRNLLHRSEVRLVTLTGAGGVGKTRLAIRVAEEVAGDFPDGVWFVALAPVRDPAHVVPTISRVLGVPEVSGRPIEEGIAAFLRERTALLILDNFEQVVDAAPAVAELLAGCPRLKILATSREVLRVSGEQRFRVPPLIVPDAAGSQSAARAGGAEAVRLFVARAEAADPTFSLTDSNAPTVSAICDRVDGLPLALELAAVRVGHLSPTALLARLDNRLPTLTGGPRGAPERLRTMRGAIAWSYDLLDPAEQVLLRRLVVLVGGFGIDAAAAVANRDGDLGLDLLDGLASLVDKSLLRPIDDVAGEPRYAMLETIREFGLEQLTTRGEDLDTRRRHAEYFRSLAEQAERSLFGRWDGRWMDRLEAEQGNLRAALAWAIEREAAETALGLVGALLPFWLFRGRDSEGYGWAMRAITLPGEAALGVRVKALHTASCFAATRGDRQQGLACCEEGLSLARASGDRTRAAVMLLQHAALLEEEGQYDRALPMFEEAFSALRSLDAPFWLAAAAQMVAVAGPLGGAAGPRDDYIKRESLLDEALAIRRDLGHPWGIAVTLQGMGELAIRQGDRAHAAVAWGECLAIYWQELQSVNATVMVERLAMHAADDDPERATRVLGATAVLRREYGTRPEPIRQPLIDAALERARIALGEPAFTAAWDEGRALPLAEAVAEAMAISSPPDATASAPQDAGAPAHGLTPRELEILGLLVEGRSNREIAAGLFISVSTVQNHVTNVLAKLEVPSRTAAVAAARRLGLA